MADKRFFCHREHRDIFTNPGHSSDIPLNSVIAAFLLHSTFTRMRGNAQP